MWLSIGSSQLQRLRQQREGPAGGKAGPAVIPSALLGPALWGGSRPTPGTRRALRVPGCSARRGGLREHYRSHSAPRRPVAPLGEAGSYLNLGSEENGGERLSVGETGTELRLGFFPRWVGFGGREGATSRGRRVLLLVPLLPAPGWDRAGEGGLPLAGERAARGWLWGAALLPHPLPGMEVSPWGEEDGACSRAVWGSDPRAGAERIPKAARECLCFFATIVTSALRVVLRHSWSSGRRLLGWAGAFPYRCAMRNWLRWVWVEVPRITRRDALDSRDLCWEVYDPLLLSLGRRCVWVQYLWPHLPFIWVCLRQRRFQRPCYLHSASDHPVAWVSFRCDFSCLK